MLKIIFLIVVVIGFIAYTGIDVGPKYDTLSDLRDQAFETVIDPLAKILLNYASKSNLNEIVDSKIENYGDIP